MRLLLLSDTHGHLDSIDGLARSVRADAIIHAGDFGFYDDASVDRLESRELFLRIIHSDLPADVKAQAKKRKGAALREFIRSKLPLSDLGAWLREGRGFSLPTFAVWGNHEDGAVVADLLAGRRSVPNLTLIAHAQHGPVRLFGLGGNVLPHVLDDDAPLEGGRGKIRATAEQIATLLDHATPREPGELRVLVTHVSPGKVPIVGLLAAALDVDITISGHMGSPYTVVWDDFCVRELDEAHRRLTAAADALPERLRARLQPPRELREHARWYRGTFNVNLPDAPDGHAVLELRDGRVRLETCSEGLRLRS